MAYDVQRFNELTKQMSAYAHYTRPEHLKRAQARAARRARVRELAAQLNERFAFRLADATRATRLRTARELLDSEYAPHQAAGRQLYATAMDAERLTERDRRLLAGEHPGAADQRYLFACRYAQRWGRAIPPAS
jgi:hypothetical protein